MCGIVGCVTKDIDASALLFRGLQHLEYRGYDSAGIAVLGGDEIQTVRSVGKLKNLEKTLSGQNLSGGTGLGHTRWATHGRPTEVNAHPHRDTTGDIVVVHNGIIENFLELQRQLSADGHAFVSETDSEVIAHLVERHYEGDLKDAVRRALAHLEGAWAIGVMHADHPDLIVGARKDSPLILGLGEGENFLASDVPAVLERTKKVVFLEDGQVAALTRDSVEICDLDGNEIPWTPVEISWSAEQAERGGFPHFMLKEIHEQPTVVSDTLLGRLEENIGGIHFEEMGLDADDLRAVTRIHIIACGTSWHAGQVAKFYIEKYARVAVEVDYASEFRYRNPVLDPDCLVIPISQSGETADTIAAMRMAAKAGARVLGVCNVIGSTIEREADGLIMTHAGPEIGVASTKAFVSQLVALLLFALRLGRERDCLSEDEIRGFCRQLRQLPKAIEEALQAEDEIRGIAKRYADAADFMFIGRGLNYPIAMEGALKLKEISYIHAEGYPAGEMKHGPIALLDASIPLVAICTVNSVYEKVINNIREARVRDARIIVVASQGDENVREVADDVIFVPVVSEDLSPIVNVVPLQLLAYHIARELGRDVDQPRNLAKSVTVE